MSVTFLSQSIVETPDGRILKISFAGNLQEGSAGNDEAAEMKRIIEKSVAEASPDAVVFDLSELQYSWGDAFCQIALPLRRSDGTFRPSCIVAIGKTADSLSALLTPNFLLGFAGVSLYNRVDVAIQHLSESLARRRPDSC